MTSAYFTLGVGSVCDLYVIIFIDMMINYMLHKLNQTNSKSLNKVKSEFPYSRILMYIVSLDDGEGQLVTVR